MFILAGIFAALMIGLRWRIGGDWVPYSVLFKRMGLLDLNQALSLSDPGFVFLNWLVAWFGGGLWMVNLLGGLIFAYGLIMFAKEQPGPWLTALIAVPYLIIVVAMGYARQGIAIGLILATLAHRNRNSVMRSTVHVVLAATFHKSAIIVIPLLAFTQKRNRIVTAALLMVTVVIIYYLFVAGATDNLMRNYVGQKYSSSGALTRVLMNVPPAVIYLSNQHKFALSNDSQKLWRNFSIAALLAVAFLVTTPSSTAVDRLSLYLIPLQMMVLGRIPYLMKGRRETGIASLLVILYVGVIQFVWLNYADNAGAWLPYHFYFPGFGEI